MKCKISIYDYSKGIFKYKVYFIGLLTCWYSKIPVQFILITSKMLPDSSKLIERMNYLQDPRFSNI